MIATRKIITIDERLCNGCGDCITACAEGALALVGGKARLVKDQFCDGFGDCIGDCPTGALRIEERAAAPFDFEATKRHVAQTGGDSAVHRLEQTAATHQQQPSGLRLICESRVAPGAGCPGSAEVSRTRQQSTEPTGPAGPRQAIPSELQQWPVQLHLVRPGAAFFRDRELVVLSTCGPVASADVHWRFLRGRSVVIACPKLDDTAPYVDKLAAILREPTIPRVMVVRMEVPCCAGLTRFAEQAVRESGRTDLAVQEVLLGRNGDVHY